MLALRLQSRAPKAPSLGTPPAATKCSDGMHSASVQAATPCGGRACTPVRAKLAARPPQLPHMPARSNALGQLSRPSLPSHDWGAALLAPECSQNDAVSMRAHVHTLQPHIIGMPSARHVTRSSHSAATHLHARPRNSCASAAPAPGVCTVAATVWCNLPAHRGHHALREH